LLFFPAIISSLLHIFALVSIFRDILSSTSSLVHQHYFRGAFGRVWLTPHHNHLVYCFGSPAILCLDTCCRGAVVSGGVVEVLFVVVWDIRCATYRRPFCQPSFSQNTNRQASSSSSSLRQSIKQNTKHHLQHLPTSTTINLRYLLYIRTPCLGTHPSTWRLTKVIG